MRSPSPGATSTVRRQWLLELVALVLLVIRARASFRYGQLQLRDNGSARSAGDGSLAVRSTAGSARLPERGNDRGTHAETPSQIGGRGWWEIARRVYQKTLKDRLSLVAAGAAFFALLSLFPGLAALVALYGLFADPA